MQDPSTEIAEDLGPRAIQAFERLTGNRVGEQGRRVFLAALEQAPTALGLEDPAAVVASLEEGSSAAAVVLARSLSVPESYFFREREGWQALEDVALPELVEVGRPLRAWSVGCARGEEPETLLMVVNRAFEEHPAVEILATDLDPQLLEDARRGVYGRQALRSVPEDMLRYFEETGEGFRIRRPCERCRVEYRTHLLMHDPLPEEWAEPASLDLILCRNLFIYFRRDAVEHALELFAGLLREGGYLLLAATDPWPRRGPWERVAPKAALFRRGS